jgi:hypothetical protein
MEVPAAEKPPTPFAEASLQRVEGPAALLALGLHAHAGKGHQTVRSFQFHHLSSSGRGRGVRAK